MKDLATDNLGWLLRAACSVCAAAGFCFSAAGASGAKDPFPDRSGPGPRVEVALKDPAGEKLFGYLLAFQGDRLQLRTLDGQPDRDLQAGQIESLHFLPLPEPSHPVPAALSPVASDKKGELPREGTGADSAKQPPHENPPGEGKKRLRERLKEFMDWTALSKLTEPEREAYRELSSKHAAKLTPAEAKELRELRQKLGLPDADLYRKVLEEYRKAQQAGKVEPFAEGQRRGMCQAENFDECRKHAIALMYYWRAREPGPPLDLLIKMEKDTAKIVDPALREQLRAGLRSLVGDFYVQSLRLEMQDRN